MEQTKNNQISALAGYAALIETYHLSVPLPRRLSAIGKHHKLYQKDNWSFFTPRYQPESSLEGHLIFALKYEGIDLAVLKQLFKTIDKQNIISLIHNKPTSSYIRKIWFLYEWLMQETLDTADATKGNYVQLVDPKMQIALAGKHSKRHRIINNLPGTYQFCPMVFLTPTIQSYIETNLAKISREIIANIAPDILSRTIAFLLLEDSKSSYTIEGEAAPTDRIQRWGRAIGEAGKHELSKDELLRLQSIIIGNARFIRKGFRKEGGFVGIHDRTTRMPIPSHISARPQDLPSLIEGLIAYDTLCTKAIDPVVAAAALAFGFVYIHPFEDGNGRLHRYLIHHALTHGGFSPEGVVFPISATILARIQEYKTVLEDYSKRLLPIIRWCYHQV